MTRILLLILCVGGTFARAEEPLTRPDLDRPMLGLITRATLAEAMPGRTPKGKPKNGLFVAGSHPNSPASAHWREIGQGSILSRIGREVIATEADLNRVLAAAPPGKALPLEISQAVTRDRQGVVWAVAQRVSVTPIAYGEWVKARVTPEKDGFLNEWYTARLQPEQMTAHDLKLEYLVRNGVAENLLVEATAANDDWVFAESIEVKVGEAVHRLPAKFARSVSNRGRTIERWSTPVTAEVLVMLQDVAFGQGEAAIAFRGKDRSVAAPLTVDGREALRVTLIAYALLGHPEILPAK